MAGVGEVGALFKDDQAIDTMDEHAFGMDLVARFRRTHLPLFLAGVTMFVIGMALQLLAARGPGAAPLIAITPQSQ
jgi:hypothetical protein